MCLLNSRVEKWKSYFLLPNCRKKNQFRLHSRVKLSFLTKKNEVKETFGKKLSILSKNETTITQSMVNSFTESANNQSRPHKESKSIQGGHKPLYDPWSVSIEKKTMMEQMLFNIADKNKTTPSPSRRSGPSVCIYTM